MNLCGLLLGGEGIENVAKELGGYGADKVIVCEHPLWPPTPPTPMRR